MYAIVSKDKPLLGGESVGVGEAVMVLVVEGGGGLTKTIN